MFDPAGVAVASWRSLKDGTQPLPTGAFLTARMWLRYGHFVHDAMDALAPCFAGSAANPRYGLGWWLSPLAARPDIVYASGAGGQALYLIPSARTIVVRFGASASFKHDAFLKRLLVP